MPLMSQDINILTDKDPEDIRQKEFKKGVERGKFESAQVKRKTNLTPARAKDAMLKALEERKATDYLPDGTAVNPWDDMTSWEIKSMIEEIITDGFEALKQEYK